MMKRILLFIFTITVFAACKKFDNVNPNVPVVVNPGVILPQVFFNISNTMINQAFELNNELIQYTCSNNSFTEIQRFKLLPSNSDPVWSGLYNRLRDLDDIIRMAEEGEGLENYKAVSIITKVYMYSILTDTYGNIPYSEAGKALTDNLYAPKYDEQKAIYTSMLDELDKASQSIDVAKGLSLGGDRLFNGNMLRWKKFANSLRLRLLMRVSGKAEMQAAGKIAQMLGDPAKYPMMESNDDNALYRYSGSLPDVHPLSQMRDFDFKYKVVSAFIVDSMKKFNDTRLFQYARPTNASVTAGNPVYVGLPNSLPITAAANYNGGFDHQSYLGVRFQTTTEPAIWMTWSEVLFLKAEAVMKGYYNGASAKDLYEKGIKGSFEFWKAPFDASYLAVPGVEFDNSLDKLYLQKFFALFFTGFEAWAEFRRTGKPAIVPGPTNTNDGKVPARLPYPLQEQSLNAANYQESISKIGGDDMNIKMWWQ